REGTPVRLCVAAGGRRAREPWRDELGVQDFGVQPGIDRVASAAWRANCRERIVGVFRIFSTDARIDRATGLALLVARRPAANARDRFVTCTRRLSFDVR